MGTACIDEAMTLTTFASPPVAQMHLHVLFAIKLHRIQSSFDATIALNPPSTQRLRPILCRRNAETTLLLASHPRTFHVAFKARSCVVIALLSFGWNVLEMTARTKLMDAHTSYAPIVVGQ